MFPDSGFMPRSSPERHPAKHRVPCIDRFHPASRFRRNSIMRVQRIAVADIIADKPNPDERTFSKDFAINLARSIESEGLLHEPIVQPIPGQPGKYKPLAGRNRLYACAKVLGWD